MKQRVYKVPDLTFELGTVLEAALQIGPGKFLIVHEWRGMRLLSDEDAFNRARPRLYLVRSKPIKIATARVTQGRLDDAADSYDRWHKRLANRLYELNFSTAKHPLGRMVRLDYRSDKWGRKGQGVEYTHDFTERRGVGPLVYGDRKSVEAAKTVVCTGGTMRVTEAGIA